jgi:hypothetical protein
LALDDIRRVATAKQQESLALERAYATTLAALTPANFFLVVGAALLALVAGTTILVENSLLTKVQSGLLALGSSALTIVHSKFECERYQAECRKLRSFYRGIAEDYGNLQLIEDAKAFQERLFMLNDQLARVAKEASAFPFDWATAKTSRASNR